MPWASTAWAKVTFPWAVVGDAGNAGDLQNDGTFGAVLYAYRISKHEVTYGQYAEFLTAVDPTGANTLELFNPHFSHVIDRDPTTGSYSVSASTANKPIQFVSWYDALRFANWLHNGQGNADTESGAYTLTGGTPIPSNANNISRNLGARVFLPSENEWYKAAYYKGGGANAGYWDYATQSDDRPASDKPPGPHVPTNSANYDYDDDIDNGYNNGRANGPDGTNVTDVGAYTASVSAYGTFDQTGNVEEWTESYVYDVRRVYRGGGFEASIFGIPASTRFTDFPTAEFSPIGFRIATIIPEPRGMALMCLGLPALLRRTRRPLLCRTLPQHIRHSERRIP
jgi:formylglycine-generating enzyme required for sulfatase activity